MSIPGHWGPAQQEASAWVGREVLLVSEEVAGGVLLAFLPWAGLPPRFWVAAPCSPRRARVSFRGDRGWGNRYKGIEEPEGVQGPGGGDP